MSSHVEECWAHQRLEEARTEAARQNLIASLREERPLRVVVGTALIRIGRWMAGTPAVQPKHQAA